MTDEHEHENSGIMCGHVYNEERPLKLIDHCPDGTWDFMCGEEDHDTQEAVDEAVVVCWECAMQNTMLPLKVQQLPKAHSAEYDSKTERWNIRPMTKQEIADINNN